MAFKRRSITPQPANNFLKISKSCEVDSQVTFSRSLSSGKTGNNKSPVLGKIFLRFNRNLTG